MVQPVLSDAERAAIRAQWTARKSGPWHEIAGRLLSDLEALLAEPSEAQLKAVGMAIMGWDATEWDALHQNARDCAYEDARAAISAWQEASRG